MTTSTLIALFMAASVTHHLPKGLLSAVCYVESRHNPAAIHHDDGSQNSLGVCQIQPRTARFMGFRGTDKDLMAPSTNVEYSARYLKYQLTRYDGDVFKAVSAYNAGSYRAKADDLPANGDYVLNVLRAHKEGK